VDTGASRRNPRNVPENAGLYWFFWFCGVAIVIALFIIALVTWDTKLFDTGIAFDGGPTTILVALLYLALSLKEVRVSEVGGAFCYGRALKHLDSGLHFLPFGLMQIKKNVRTVQSFQCPGEPETVQKGDDKVSLEPGKVRPIRAVTRAPSDEEKDILDTRMTLDLNFVVQYAVTDIFDYVANFGNKEEVEKQLRDIGEATLAEEVTKNTPRTFIEKLADINKNLVEATQLRFENSGVRIISVRLISPDITHDVSSALANIPVERAKAVQTVVKAEAEKTKRTKEGEGTAAAELALLNARAEGQKKMKEELEVAGEAVLAAQAVRELSDKTDVLVVGAEGGMKDVMGLIKGAQSALNSKVTKGTTP
jgi:regulator of protease activity HflC (stomatin/prohibitin superfamily)